MVSTKLYLGECCSSYADNNAINKCKVYCNNLE